MAALVFELLLASGFLLSRKTFPEWKQLFPDGPQYKDSALRLAQGKGYTTTILDCQHRACDAPYSGLTDYPNVAYPVNPPRYPPGYPLFLAVFAAAGSLNYGVRVAAVMLIFAVAWAAFDFEGPLAAMLAVFLAMIGTFTHKSSYFIMSDAFSAALAVAILPLVRRGTPRAVYAAGLLAGYGVLVRQSGVLVLVCLLIVIENRDRIRALIAVAPPILGLAAYQWATFGRPWRTGYDFYLPNLRLWAPDFVSMHPIDSEGAFLFPDQARERLADWACNLVSCTGTGALGGGLPNWLFYPLVVAGAFWIFSLPFVTLGGLTAATWQRREPAAKFTLLLTVVTIVALLPYFYQATRFMAAPAMMLVVWCAIGFARLIASLSPVPLRSNAESDECTSQYPDWGSPRS